MSIIKDLPIFKGLTDNDFDKIDKIIEEKTFADGTVLFKQDDAPDAFYIVKAGAVRIVRHDETGDRELASLQAGDFFGEMGIVSDSPRMADAVIAGETTLLVIEKHEFHQLLAVNPTISMKIMSMMSCRHRARHAGEGEAPGTSEGVLVGVFSATGGVGNSFLAANLATCLHHLTKKKVLVMDLDLMFGDQGGIFDVKSPNSISLLTDSAEIGIENLRDCIDRTRWGVDLLQAPHKPEDAEAVTASLILTCIEVLRPYYDYIVCDTANVIQEANINLLEQVQVPIYLLTPEVLSVKNASRWFSVMDMIRYDTDAVRLVLNKYQPTDKATVKYLEEQFHRQILGTVPQAYDAVRESLNKGKLISREDPDCSVSQHLRQVAGKVAGIEVKAVEEKPFWKRLIGV